MFCGANFVPGWRLTCYELFWRAILRGLKWCKWRTVTYKARRTSNDFLLAYSFSWRIWIVLWAHLMKFRICTYLYVTDSRLKTSYKMTVRSTFTTKQFSETADTVVNQIIKQLSTKFPHGNLTRCSRKSLPIFGCSVYYRSSCTVV